MNDVMCDVVTVMGPEVVSLLSYLTEEESTQVKTLVKELQEWNFRLDVDSRGGVIYEVFRFVLPLNDPATKKILRVETKLRNSAKGCSIPLICARNK